MRPLLILELRQSPPGVGRAERSRFLVPLPRHRRIGGDAAHVLVADHLRIEAYINNVTNDKTLTEAVRGNDTLYGTSTACPDFFKAVTASLNATAFFVEDFSAAHSEPVAAAVAGFSSAPWPEIGPPYTVIHEGIAYGPGAEITVNSGPIFCSMTLSHVCELLCCCAR